MKRVPVLVLLWLVFATGSLAADDRNACWADLPDSFRGATEKTYKGWRLLALDDLVISDRVLWTRVRGDQCPGVAKGKFAPEAGIDTAVVLVRADGGKRRVRLVVGSKSSVRTIHQSAVTNYPVIRRADPGKYRSFDGKKEFESKTDVIIYEHVESRVLVFFHSKGKFGHVVTVN